MKNFWKKLKKPIFCLAPMADVTDCAFRQIIAKYGKPDVFWTEFVSADGLTHEKGKKKLLVDLQFLKNEHPIVAQLFGSNPKNMKKAAALCKKLGFDGIDINMGCPDKSIEKQNSGAAMMKNPKLAKMMIKSAKEGAKGLPISVKTRIGYYNTDMEWIKNLLEEDISALTVHLRTRKEMSKVPAHWELMREIVKMRNKINKDILIIGNGDITDINDARKKYKETGCDGVMLGRAIFGNPFLFNEKRRPFEFFVPEGPTLVPSMRPKKGAGAKNLKGRNLINEKLKILIEHTKLFEKKLGKVKSFNIMKKHFKAYVNGFDGAKELRTKLMETKNAKGVEKIIKEFLK